LITARDFVEFIVLCLLFEQEFLDLGEMVFEHGVEGVAGGFDQIAEFAADLLDAGRGC
jgi:hypothetical protein